MKKEEKDIAFEMNIFRSICPDWSGINMLFPHRFAKNGPIKIPAMEIMKVIRKAIKKANIQRL